MLNSLSPLLKKRKRIGRGGSRGGTSGKGHKGQKARSGGYIRPGFEGGQMPLFRRLPRRGFNNANFKTESIIVSILDLEKAFNAGDQVTAESLMTKGLISQKKGIKQQNFRVKILGGGELSKKLIVTADAFSKSAVEAIQKSGGEARLIKEN
jgi:large subunit ribosomal protein L15